MRKFCFGTMCIALAISPAAAAQFLSPALSNYLTENGGKLVYLETTKILPNGATAHFRGTGFVISSSGDVLTAAHVVDGITRESLGQDHSSEFSTDATFNYKGRLGSKAGQLEDLHLVLLDDLRDLALLRFEGTRQFQAFEVASGAGLRPPEAVLALGFPLGSDTSVPALGRITGTGQADGRWLIDAAVNPGHSGGPVIRRDGRVVGVVHAGIQGATLMNLMLPLKSEDPILSKAGVKQVAGLPTSDPDTIPPRTGWNDIPLEGACEERRKHFENLAKGIHWACAEATVDRGGSNNVERTQNVRVTIPGSAALLDVRYFHRSRGDWQAPVEGGPWHSNAPGGDLQWMSIESAQSRTSGVDRIVEARCRNWSHNMRMFCALGVQYRAGAWLW